MVMAAATLAAGTPAVMRAVAMQVDTRGAAMQVDTPELAVLPAATLAVAAVLEATAVVAAAGK